MMTKSKIKQPEGNYYDKYGSQNFIVKWLMKGFFFSLKKLVGYNSGGYILEAGCGEGYVTEFFRRIVPNSMIEGFDVSEKVIKQATRDYPEIHFFVHNIYEKLEEKQYDLIVCCEVLEHMERPEDAVKNLMKNSKEFIFSVPREPIWRIMNLARGKYVRDLGNTPGHIQHFSRRSLKKVLIGCGLEVVRWKTPLPWLMVYCRKLSNE